MATQKGKIKDGGTSFMQKLTSDQLKYFNTIAKKPFSEQGIAFLNAYWEEVNDQKEFIFHVAWEQIKKTEMRFNNVDYIHLYNEGSSLAIDAALHFFEQLFIYCDDEKNDYTGTAFKKSGVKMMTANARKKEIKKKVDANNDGRLSFLEYLLYTYMDIDGVNPGNFVKKHRQLQNVHQDVQAAQDALNAVLKQIRNYEGKKKTLTDKVDKAKSSVKAGIARGELNQLINSPLAEELNRLLILAEAAVRKAKKKHAGAKGGMTEGGTNVGDSSGALFWIDSVFEATKSKYSGVGKKKKK